MQETEKNNKKKRRQKRIEEASKKRGNKYFHEVHENAFSEYVRSEDFKKRNELYVDIIQPVLRTVIDKIVNTYKFYKIPNIDSLKLECESHLITVLDKFDPDRVAFTYFSVVVKHWFIHKSKKNQKRLLAEQPYVPDEFETVLVEEDTIEDDLIRAEFIRSLLNEIEKWEKESNSNKEAKVLKAIRILFKTVDSLDDLSMKAVRLYLREISGLSSKDVSFVIGKIKKHYRSFRAEWHNG